MTMYELCNELQAMVISPYYDTDGKEIYVSYCYNGKRVKIKFYLEDLKVTDDAIVIEI